MSKGVIFAFFLLSLLFYSLIHMCAESADLCGSEAVPAQRGHTPAQGRCQRSLPDCGHGGTAI